MSGRTFTGLRFYSCEGALVLVGQDSDDAPIYECAWHHEKYALRNGQYEETPYSENYRCMRCGNREVSSYSRCPNCGGSFCYEELPPELKPNAGRPPVTSAEAGPRLGPVEEAGR